MLREEEIIERFPFYAKLGKRNKEYFLQKCNKATFSKKAQLLPSTGASFIFIRKGALNVFATGDNGEEGFAFRVGKNEACFVSEKLIYKFCSNSEVIFIDEDTATWLKGVSVEAENLLLKLKIKNLESAMQCVNEIVFSSVDRRIAKHLLNETARTHNNTVSVTHEELAVFIWSSREVVTRRLKALVEVGAIETSRGKIVIKNRDYLKKIK